ncbi:DASH outer kinetochore protein [Cristinia sonorae]|uniref:DASH complex subunit DAD1 n=1 Tax=Cristinia sonorae TaxID=1940300 RepID=A0A8K0XSQ2_9AGAR|nr:DASH outer kinetochore protein [Cristinia sonorae]
MATDENAFFNKERDRLTAEITSGFEELLSSSNTLNRKLEEVLGMTREYETIASLWQSFHELMRGQKDESTTEGEEVQGLPGTGGHVIATTQTQ